MNRERLYNLFKIRSRGPIIYQPKRTNFLTYMAMLRTLQPVQNLELCFNRIHWTVKERRNGRRQ